MKADISWTGILNLLEIPHEAIPGEDCPAHPGIAVGESTSNHVIWLDEEEPELALEPRGDGFVLTFTDHKGSRVRMDLGMRAYPGMPAD